MNNLELDREIVPCLARYGVFMEKCMPKKSVPRFNDREFCKSTYSRKPGVHCVEVAQKAGITAVRNSNDATKNTVFFTQNEWKAFVAGVKNNEFNV